MSDRPDGSCTRTAPLQTHTGAVEIICLSSGRRLVVGSDRRTAWIGTAAQCDLRLDDPFASALHCSARLGTRGLEIRDRDSKNGTYVGGARVSTAVIRPGARLRLGHSDLEVRPADGRRGFERIVGRAPALRRAIELAQRAAAAECNVLILGETGTGKELLARAIHDGSARAGGPFVALNCGAIPGELVAAELFGHVRGAFTGAVSDRPGVFTRAHRGTLFLDELGELPAEQQPHLLRVLETGVIEAVGGGAPQRVDVRLVAATNALDVGTENSALRTDLYHRVATVVVELPPLRQRRRDIPLLIQHFMDELEGRYGRRTITDTTVAALCRMRWTGNVRELRQAVHRASALSPGELTLEHLAPPRMRGRALAGDHDGSSLPPIDMAARDLMETAYRRYGTVRRAAASLGMAKSTFADRARRYGLVLGKGRSDRPGAGRG